MELSWATLQPIFQLAVALNFGVTLITQLSDVSIKGERNLVDSITAAVDKMSVTNLDHDKEISFRQSVGDFNRVYDDLNWGIKFVRSRLFTYMLYLLCMVSLALLLVAATECSGSVPSQTIFMLGALACCVPVLAGIFFMASERLLLQKLVDERIRALEKLKELV